MKPKLYFAAPLFSQAERTFNVMLEAHLSETFDVFLPQRDNHLFVELVASGLSIEAAQQRVFDGDLDAIEGSDVLLMVLDGRCIDEGACFELGFAYAMHKTCIGLQTDPRRLLPIGNNPMIERALSKSFQTVEELLHWARQPDFN